MAKSLHTPAYKKFTHLLNSARETSGLTQLEVSLKLSRPQSFVAKYEGGERRIDVVEFIEICAALNVSPVAILEQLQNK